MRKTIFFYFTIIGLLFYIISSCNNPKSQKKNKVERSERKKTITDTISENTTLDTSFLSTVKIGDQEWMTSNLKKTEFINGDHIKRCYSKKEWVLLNKQKKPCYRIINGNYYYNGYALMDHRGLVPKEFRIPLKKDWEILQSYLGGIIPMSKSITDYKWKINTVDSQIEHSGNNSLGFNAKATGCVLTSGEYNKGSCSFWWSLAVPFINLESKDNIYQDLSVYSVGFCSVEYEIDNIINPSFGCCIRCIKK